MKKAIRLSGFATFSLICFLCAEGWAAPFTLQHGVGGYLGCTDSYLANDGYSSPAEENYGSSTDLLLNSEHFNGG